MFSKSFIGWMHENDVIVDSIYFLESATDGEAVSESLFQWLERCDTGDLGEMFGKEFAEYVSTECSDVYDIGESTIAKAMADLCIDGLLVRLKVKHTSGWCSYSFPVVRVDSYEQIESAVRSAVEDRTGCKN